MGYLASRLQSFLQLNVILFATIPVLICLYLPIVLLAPAFKSSFLYSTLKSPSGYVFGYFSGVIVISFYVFLTYLLNQEISGKFDDYTERFFIGLAATGLFLSSIRWMPILMEKLGFNLSQQILSQLALDIFYLLPPVLIFVLMKNLTLHGSITRKGELIGDLDTAWDDALNLFSKMWSNGIDHVRKMEPEEVPDSIPNFRSYHFFIILEAILFPLMMGLATYFIEVFILPKASLVLIFGVYLILVAITQLS